MKALTILFAMAIGLLIANAFAVYGLAATGRAACLETYSPATCQNILR